MPNPNTTPQVVMGVDFGLKKMGIAIGQAITKTATPLATISAKQGTPDWIQLDKLINEWKPQAFIVGIPINMDDTEAPITLQAKNFAQVIQNRYNRPVFCIDERLTSREAREQLQQIGKYTLSNRKLVDQIAAQILVESWFRENTK